MSWFDDVGAALDTQFHAMRARMYQQDFLAWAKAEAALRTWCDHKETP